MVVFPDVLSCFLFDGLAYFCIRCLLSPFPAISRHFVIRARVGDDILDLCGLLIALAILDALCWIMSVMVSLMVSMSSSSVSQFQLEFDLLSYSCGIYSWWRLRQNCLPFNVYVQFDVAQNQSGISC